MVLYDNIYDVEDYFGGPYPELIEFFKNLPERGHILDLGCGQGRDAISLARLGYKVTGVDVSKLGVDQMIKRANEQKLEIVGLVDEMFSFTVEDKYDIVLLDSMLHFEKNDRKKEVNFLRRITSELKENGILCICIWKSAKNEKLVRDLFHRNSTVCEVLKDSYVDYTFKDKKSDHRVDMQYKMYIVKKAKHK